MPRPEAPPEYKGWKITRICSNRWHATKGGEKPITASCRADLFRVIDHRTPEEK